MNKIKIIIFAMIIFSIEKLFVSKKLSPILAKVFNFILLED
ncbi:MAG: hypothetical protein SOI14_05180 [Lactococcus cremoris]|nr:hypothetical protein LLNZ_04015 [Lactococcus cremoris subsp. cremoris NZ9000]KZK36278.1 hypothetical protein N41_1934 [Lactococcus cremoris]KZK49574.1 hypothetical protein NCDO763_2063 [Lactococcus cremoris]